MRSRVIATAQRQPALSTGSASECPLLRLCGFSPRKRSHKLRLLHLVSAREQAEGIGNEAGMWPGINRLTNYAPIADWADGGLKPGFRNNGRMRPELANSSQPSHSARWVVLGWRAVATVNR